MFRDESKMEKIINNTVDETPKEADERKDKDRINLNDVEYHSAFDYEYMLKRIADQVGET